MPVSHRMTTGLSSSQLEVASPPATQALRSNCPVFSCPVPENPLTALPGLLQCSLVEENVAPLPGRGPALGSSQNWVALPSQRGPPSQRPCPQQPATPESLLLLFLTGC